MQALLQVGAEAAWPNRYESTVPQKTQLGVVFVIISFDPFESFGGTLYIECVVSSCSPIEI